MPHREAQNSSSFRGMNATTPTMSAQLRRPKTVPNLVSYGTLNGSTPEGLPRRLPKLLLNVRVQGSLGPVQVVMTPESTVGDLVAAAVRQYVKECRRPVVSTTDPSAFDLHYSQFSLESLERDEKLMELGSRNFFLCPRKCSSVPGEVGAGNGGTVTTQFASCSREMDKVTKTGFAWLNFKLMDFLL